MVFRYLFCLCIAVLFSAPAFAQTQIHGSTSFKAAVFQSDIIDGLPTKASYEVYSSSSGRGLMALHQGKADIAMISANIHSLANAIKSEGVDFNVDDYIVHNIAETQVMFVVHPDNPISEITHAQLQSLLLGQTSEWKNISNDIPLGGVRLITEHPTGGIYNTVKIGVLNDQNLSENKTVMQNAPQVAIVVAQLPEAFGFLAGSLSDNLKKRVKILSISDAQIPSLTLSLVTKKDDTRQAVSDVVQHIKNAVQ